MPGAGEVAGFDWEKKTRKKELTTDSFRGCSMAEPSPVLNRLGRHGIRASTSTFLPANRVLLRIDFRIDLERYRLSVGINTCCDHQHIAWL